ncbi:MAG: RNA polymerase sigma factor [Acidimicrobiaceae bacterium]|nr:RNA polymerase sigma factor [Acidimicrobiia bacterium]MCY4492476.1 RNA polymerase sigma factor [Acidimicrobiaceae bacterium]
MDETTLIDAAQRGDRQALDQLLRSHQSRIHAICRRIAGNDADALDATQEALIAIVKGLPRFDGRSKFSTWAYRIATNACIDELRRRRRQPAPGLPEHEHADTNPMASSAPRDPADTVSARIDIDRGLKQLPEEFRTAVVLRDVAGLNYNEIAEVLNIAPGTVRSRIARGRRRLVNAMNPGDSRNQPPLDNRQND